SLLELFLPDGTKVPPSPPAPRRLPGRGRFGPFELLEEIGRGGMGVVYRATDTRLGRTVALKTILGRVNAGKEERFRREGRALAKLRHPGIVTLYEADVIAGSPYVALEFVH